MRCTGFATLGRNGPRCAALLVLATSLSCGDRTAGWAGSVEELEGGGRIVRNPETGLWANAGRAWVLEEELRIGRQEGDGPDVFGAIGGIHVDEWGRIYVIETQAREIRVFDADGSPSRVLGGAGEGPGEFRSPTGVFLDDRGTTWVVDGGNARYTRFDSTGAVIETRPRQSRAIGSGPFLGGLTANGVLYDTDLHVPEESANLPPLLLAAGMGGSRLILRAMFAMDSSEVGDTVDLPAPTVEPVTFQTQGMMIASPFNPRLHLLFDSRGSIWWGESGEYRIYQRTLEGDTLMRIERVHTPLPVSSSDIDEWLASDGVTRFRERGGSVDASRVQSVKPRFDGLFLDDGGFLWVRVITADDVTRFDVFDAEGRYLGVVDGTAEMSRQAPVINGDRFHVIVRGEFDVPYVVRYRIRSRNP